MTIAHLNYKFLRQCPGVNLHKTSPTSGRPGRERDYPRMEAALIDFQYIFMNEKSGALVIRMLSKFAQTHIIASHLTMAKSAPTDDARISLVNDAYKNFDRLAICLNHLFVQFSVNQTVTRSGFIPRQDEKITREIYIPTLKVLSDEKWKSVTTILTLMFEDYRDQNHAEVITKAHSAVQKFLQILVGDKEKNGKRELGKLFGTAKTLGLIPANRFTEPMISVFQGYFSSERAEKSTAKPAKETADAKDSLLMMNVVMVFLQHCLQHSS